MNVASIFSTSIGWTMRTVVLKFFVIGGVLAVMSALIPWVIEYVVPHVGEGALGALSAFWAAIPPGLWWFLDAMQVSYGIPLLLSAYVTRFLIRRIPFFG